MPSQNENLILKFGILITIFLADINDNDNASPSDQMILLGAFGDSIGKADLNHDGSVTTSDLTIYLGASGSSIPAGDLSALNSIVGYDGYLYEEATGLYCVRNRWYDADTGRWISRDPLGYIDGSNMYEYVSSNSLKFIDPFGLEEAAPDEEFQKVNSVYCARIEKQYLDGILSKERYRKQFKQFACKGTPTHNPDDVYGGETDVADTYERYTTTVHNAAKKAGNTIDTGIVIVVVAGSVFIPGPDEMIAASWLLKNGARCYRVVRKTKAIKKAQKGLCFAVGTSVATEQGNVAIENLKLGDRVFSFDNEQGDYSLVDVESDRWSKILLKTHLQALSPKILADVTADGIFLPLNWLKGAGYNLIEATSIALKDVEFVDSTEVVRIDLCPVFSIVSVFQAVRSTISSVAISLGSKTNDLFATDNSSPNPDDFNFIEPHHWRKIKLVMDLPDGGRCDIFLLRPLPWIETMTAEIGGSVYLSMPEIGIHRDARVISIEPCGKIEQPIPGLQTVTGRFITTNARVLDLHVSLLSEPIGTTANHPFWSIDRNGWVSAGDLRIGESLRTEDGSLTVSDLIQRALPETVYNVEVHKDHTFYVSDAKILVHNACSPYQMQKAIDRGQAPKGIKRVDKGNPETFEMPHVHFKGGHALRIDGTWKHGKIKLTNAQKKWLRDNGWKLPDEI